MSGIRRVKEVVSEFSWQLSGIHVADDALDCASELLLEVIPAAGLSHGRIDLIHGAVSHRNWPNTAFELQDMKLRLLSSYRDHPMIGSFLPGVDVARALRGARAT